MSDSEHDLLGAYALDAVDDVERHRFEHHLRTCEPCRRELSGLQSAAASLSVGLDVAPPARLRSAVLTRVTTEAGTPRTGGAPHRPNAPSQHRIDRRLFLGAAAAGIVGVASVGLWRTTRKASPAQLAEDILDDPSARRATTTYAGSSVTLARASDGRAAIRFDPAPEAVAGKSYTVWTDAPGAQLTNVGTVPTGGEAALVIDDTPAGLRGVAVTLEAAGTHPAAPTSAPILAVHLA